MAKDDIQSLSLKSFIYKNLQSKCPYQFCSLALTSVHRFEHSFGPNLDDSRFPCAFGARLLTEVEKPPPTDWLNRRLTDQPTHCRICVKSNVLCPTEIIIIVIPDNCNDVQQWTFPRQPSWPSRAESHEHVHAVFRVPPLDV